MARGEIPKREIQHAAKAQVDGACDGVRLHRGIFVFHDAGDVAAPFIAGGPCEAHDQVIPEGATGLPCASEHGGVYCRGSVAGLCRCKAFLADNQCDDGVELTHAVAHLAGVIEDSLIWHELECECCMM